MCCVYAARGLWPAACKLCRLLLRAYRVVSAFFGLVPRLVLCVMSTGCVAFHWLFLRL